MKKISSSHLFFIPVLMFFTLECVGRNNVKQGVINDIIFIHGFEYALFELNDTGQNWAADSNTANNLTCSSQISGLQDCHQGRDVEFNDNSDGFAGFSFSKISASGTVLPSNSTLWSCVKDNVTGLLWEVKTTDGGIHDRNHVYAWGGVTAIGLNHPQSEGVYLNDWDSLVNDSNSNNFCGRSNWRLPNVTELFSIVNKGAQSPAIDTNYFPNTQSNWYWTRTPDAFNPLNAWLIFFDFGSETGDLRSNQLYVRLVSTQQLGGTQ